eukprot:CAMPEP_0178754956 /NCGR_PEP_ID=MMETSP0744-20121128/12449_1 /TAXON_ID=913974 /ORGANISM="Nitzschia punctata, Strain CCMP561" /LENGTH=280 /DNA_ID=CAMNT_0020408929 /DNA_START=20 /DNA_END=859 /DNA_ORIENTATION=+
MQNHSFAASESFSYQQECLNELPYPSIGVSSSLLFVDVDVDVDTKRSSFSTLSFVAPSWTALPYEFQINLICNFVSLILFLCFRNYGFFQRCYQIVQYAWVLQFVVLFTTTTPTTTTSTTKTTATWPQMIIAYGFFMDYALLKSINDIPLRFLTNLVHHMTLFVPTTPIERCTYAVCWTAHLFSWFRLFLDEKRYHLVLKWALQAGNMTPVVALVWCLFVARKEATTTPATILSQHGWAVLSQMAVYRGIYVNASYSVFSRMGLVSKATEQHVIKVAGKW